MTVDQAEAIRDRSCNRKKAWRSHHGAERNAEVLRRDGQDVHSYRCSWGRHWHIGHQPSIQSLELIAIAIRVLHQRKPLRVP